MAKLVKLGENANIFHDQATGFTLIKGETKTLTDAQMVSRRIKSAIQSGHLVYAESPVDDSEKNDKLLAKFKSLYNEGVEPVKLGKTFNMDSLKAIAKALDIEPEKGDTKEILVDAIIESIEEESK